MGMFYNNPRDLTPNQVIYLEDYCKKSKDYPEEFKSIPEHHYVYEWSDGGFIDYTIEDNSGVDYKGEYIKDKSFYIWCLYSKKNTLQRCKDIVRIAKKDYECNNIRFSTFRKKDAWIRRLSQAGIKIEEEQTIFKCNLEDS
jgi:hypothetical protein